MRWILCKDMMPEENKSILFMNIHGQFYVGKYINTFFYEKNDYSNSIDWSLIKSWIYLKNIPKPNQPERSKREDSQKCEMRCSEHCRNAVRDK